MEIALVLRSTLSAIQQGNIPVCVIGEIALNYYNVPRVVHDIELCVPETSLSKAVSILCSTGQFRREERTEYDIFTKYKRGFPTLRAASQTNLAIVIFPDTYFYLSPMSQSIVSLDGKPSATAYSRQIVDVVPDDEIKNLPVPRLPPYFIGLCRRFFESNDDIARIAVEQLVDGMQLDEEWLQINLSGATEEVQQLATMLVDERSTSNDEFEVPYFAADDGKRYELRWIPGSGFQ